MYKISSRSGLIIRTFDNAVISPDGANADYVKYLAWLSGGNTPVSDGKSASDIAWENIKTERDRRMLSGGYAVNDKWFHSDTLSRTQQLGLLLLGSNIPDGLQWKTMDGSFILVTPLLAQQIFNAATLSDLAIFTAGELHKIAMLASPDPANYNYLTGWPLIFGE
jgi:hypothetical protein